MSDIPKAFFMVAVAKDLLKSATEVLEQAQSLLPREKGLPRTPTKSRRVSKAVAGMIISYKSENPDASLQEIADHFSVNQGRVSEVLREKRKFK
jgi:hypothetical protein